MVHGRCDGGVKNGDIVGSTFTQDYSASQSNYGLLNNILSSRGMAFLRDAPFALFILGRITASNVLRWKLPESAYAFIVAGVYVPYFFTQSYAPELGIAEDMTFTAVAIMNAARDYWRHET
jgi:hypothetical protein